MIVLYGIYENGKITLKDKNLPNLTADVEIIIRQKSWNRKIKRVKLSNNNLASETIIKLREEN